MIQRPDPPPPDPLIDRVLPYFEATKLVRLEVGGDAATVYETARSVDFLQVHSPLTDAAMWVRGLPERVRRREPEVLPAMRLSDLFDHPGTRPADDPLAAWVALGEVPGRELVFGAVGKVWRPNIEWARVASADFTDFAEPGWAKIAVAIAVRPRSPSRSVIAYEARTATTSPDAAVRFRWYWRIVSPFVRAVMGAYLKTVRAEVEG